MSRITQNCKRSALRLLGILLLGIALGACGNDLGTAQGVADEFVDQHYVHIDLTKAKALTASLALHKLNEELRLTAGQKIDASTQKPRVNYKLLEKREDGERATYLYEGKIQSDDGTSFVRKWLVTVRRVEGQWRISNFTESD